MAERNYKTFIETDLEEIIRKTVLERRKEAAGVLIEYTETEAYKGKTDMPLYIGVSSLCDWFDNYTDAPSDELTYDINESYASSLDPALAVFFLYSKSLCTDSENEEKELLNHALEAAEDSDCKKAIALAHIALSDVDYDNETKHLETATEILTRLYGENDWRVLMTEGKLAYSLYDNQERIEKLTVLRKKAEACNADNAVIVSILRLLSDVYSCTEEYEKTIETLKEACALIPEDSESRGRMQSLIISKLRTLGKNEAALEFAMDALGHITGDSTETLAKKFNLYSQIITIRLNMNDNDGALELARAQYDLFMKYDTSIGLVTFVLSASTLILAVKRAKGEEEAVALFREAFPAILSKAPDSESRIMEYFMLYLFAGLSRESSRKCIKALMEDCNENKALRFACLMSLKSLCKPDEVDTALEYMQEALDCADTDGRKAEAMVKIGDIYYQRNPKRPIRYMKQALDLFNKAGVNGDYEELYEHAMLVVANADMHNQDYEEASALWKKLYSYYDEAHLDQEATKMLENYAAALSSLDRYDESLECYRTAVDRRRQETGEDAKGNLASALMNMGIALSNVDNNEEAFNMFHESYTIYSDLYGKKNREANDALIFAAKELHYLGRNKESLLLGTRAYNMLSSDDRDLKKEALSVLFITNDALGNKKKAKEFLDKLHNQFPETR